MSVHGGQNEGQSKEHQYGQNKQVGAEHPPTMALAMPESGGWNPPYDYCSFPCLRRGLCCLRVKPDEFRYLRSDAGGVLKNRPRPAVQMVPTTTHHGQAM